MYARISVQVFLCIQYLRMYVCMYVCACIYIRIHTYTYSYIHTRTYMSSRDTTSQTESKLPMEANSSHCSRDQPSTDALTPGSSAGHRAVPCRSWQ